MVSSRRQLAVLYRGGASRPPGAEAMHFLLRRGLVYLLPLFALAIALTARLAAPDLLDRLMLISFDFYQRVVPREAEDSPISIVDIDEASLNQYGQWPWARSLDAQLIDKLRDAGAAMTVFDIVFSEPDRTSPKMLLDQLMKRGTVDDETQHLLGNLPDPDDMLAAAIKSVPTIASYILVDHADNPLPLQKAGYAFAGDEPLRFVDRFAAAIDDLPPFQAGARGNGFLNEHVDWDQIVRRVPLIMELKGKPVFSLVAETLRVVTGAHTYVARAAGANGEMSFGENTGLTQLRIGPLTIPTDAAGRVWVYYAKPNLDRFVSAAKILSGDFDPALIKGHIVLIGTSAEGVVNDLQATPLGAGVPGVEIHAQLLEQILQGVYLSRPDWAKGREILFTLIAGIFLVVDCCQRIGALASALFGVAAIVVEIAISWFAFRYWHLLIDPIYPTAVLVLVYFVSSVLGYLRTEVRQQRNPQRAFSRYMSPHYVAELARNPEKLQLGGESENPHGDVLRHSRLHRDVGGTRRARAHSSDEQLHLADERYHRRGAGHDRQVYRRLHHGVLERPARRSRPRQERGARRAADPHQAGRSQPPPQGGVAEASGRIYHELRVGIGVNTGGECVVGEFRLGDALQLFAARRPGEPRLAARWAVQALSR